MRDKFFCLLLLFQLKVIVLTASISAHNAGHGEKDMSSDVIDALWSDFNESDRCTSLLRQFAAPSSFALVGHFTHSLTLRNLRRFFDVNATETNYIPTIDLRTEFVNQIKEKVLEHFSSDDPLSAHANDYPLPEGSEHFVSQAMKTLDMVLAHMDDKNWDIKYFTTLEKIVHTFHMEEVWAKAQVAYSKLLTSIPPSSDVCECVMDIEKNGILKFLRFSALAIREPSLIYNNALKDHRKDKFKGYGFVYPIYTYHFKNFDSMKSQSGLLLRQEKDSMPRLNSAKSWNDWKRIGCTSIEEDYNNALFMYCAVQKAHKV